MVLNFYVENIWKMREANSFKEYFKTVYFICVCKVNYGIKFLDSVKYTLNFEYTYLPVISIY